MAQNNLPSANSVQQTLFTYFNFSNLFSMMKYIDGIHSYNKTKNIIYEKQY